MAITISGNGVITGLSVGGLPDGTVDAGTLATNSVDSSEIVSGGVDNSHLSTGIDAGKLINALPAISGASLTSLPVGLNRASADGAYNASTTGTFTISSLSFDPIFLCCIFCVNNSGYASIGFASNPTGYPLTASQYVLYDNSDSGTDWASSQGYFGRLNLGSSNFSNLAVQSWDSGGVTIVKTKDNSHTVGSSAAYKILLLG